MLHKAWNSKEEMPYCFPRSSIKFQGHTGQNITDFDPNWAFPDYRAVAAFKSLRFALLTLKNGWAHTPNDPCIWFSVMGLMKQPLKAVLHSAMGIMSPMVGKIYSYLNTESCLWLECLCLIRLVQWVLLHIANVIQFTHKRLPMRSRYWVSLLIQRRISKAV